MELAIGKANCSGGFVGILRGRLMFSEVGSE